MLITPLSCVCRALVDLPTVDSKETQTYEVTAPVATFYAMCAQEKATLGPAKGSGFFFSVSLPELRLMKTSLPSGKPPRLPWQTWLMDIRYVFGRIPVPNECGGDTYHIQSAHVEAEAYNTSFTGTILL